MIASMAQPFPHPGSMPGHAGMPPGSHPMAAGHPGAQGIPGGQPGMISQQMHAMGPQMSQGAMMQMTPGVGGPNAHAMSHLGPNNAMAAHYHQQQQQMQQALAAQNPQAQALQQQQQQQQRIRQQQMQAQAQAHQQAMILQQNQGGMAMNPAQQQLIFNQRMAAAAAGGGGVGLPPHLAAGMQQQLSHPGFMAAQGAQQQQQQTLQHMAAMQHASLQQAQAQQQANNQAATQAGATPGQPAVQPMRPPSTIAGGPDGQNTASAAAAIAVQQQQQQAQQQAQAQAHAQAAQQAAQQQQQSQNQQPPNTQPSQAGAQAISQAQNIGTSQPQTNPQQPQTTPQQAQQTQQMPQQAGQPGQAAQDANAAKNAQMQAGQMRLPQQAMNNLAFQRMQLQAQQAQQQPKHFAVKLYQFSQTLNETSLEPGSNNPAGDLSFWKVFVKKFFSDTAILRQEHLNAKTEKQKQFEVPAAVIARFYWTQFNSRVKNIQMATEQLMEHQLPGGGHSIECHKATFFYWYTNGQQVVMTGSLKVTFNREVKFDVFEFSCQEWNEYVTLKSIPTSPEQKHSPTTTKKGQKGQAQQQRDKSASSPRPTVNDWGFADALLPFFELTETFNRMSSLFEFAQNNTSLSPSEALRQLVLSYESNNHMMNNMPGQFNPAMQSGAATPNSNFNGPQHFNSPGGAHLGLPNTASPASMNMSPAMQNHSLQQNAGGSSGASANTSPNVTNKRRRASQVKMEGDGETPEANGPKVKPSPRVTKRAKPGM